MEDLRNISLMGVRIPNRYILYTHLALLNKIYPLCDKPNLKITQVIHAFEYLHPPGTFFQNLPQVVYGFELE